jgi:hypothetical protein
VSRSRARDAANQLAAAAPEPYPVLVKAAPAEMPVRDAANGLPPIGEPRRGIPFPGMPPAAVLRSSGPPSDSAPRDPAGVIERHVAIGSEGYRDANGNGSRPPASQPGELRRTLHLSLAHSNGAAEAGEPDQASLAPTATNRFERSDSELAPLRQTSGGFHNGGGNGSAHVGSAVPSPPPRPRIETEDRHPRDSFIDQSLRERVESEIRGFLAAFDAALSEDSAETRAGLREATDRLLRAGARTRIELERLEARLPLPPRDNGAREQFSWRPR